MLVYKRKNEDESLVVFVNVHNKIQILQVMADLRLVLVHKIKFVYMFIRVLDN